MSGEDPEDPPEFDTAQKIAVNGTVVAELRTKPEVLMSGIEDEALGVILSAQFGSPAQEDEEDEEDTEALKKYDPEIQIWGEGEDEDEPSWTPPANLSETHFLDVYETL
jgi:hypothetical protein